jgi:flagellar basal-body rod protein FlgF/flagellar basal-body rod protein FlgG
MAYGLYLSAAGANAQDHRLQIIAHNLANVQTPGYKPQEAALQARFAEAIERGLIPAPSHSPADQGGGVTIGAAETRFATGSIRPTGVQTDFAIPGEQQFFVVQRGNETLFTRAGNFRFDNEGRLVTADGDQVLGSDGQTIEINPSQPFEILDGGVIRQAADQWELQLAQPRFLGDLTRIGTNAFRPLAPFDLVSRDQRQVLNGHLEDSAVEPTTTLVQMIEASRAYEANIRMIQNQDHVMGSLVSRVLQSQ